MKDAIKDRAYWLEVTFRFRSGDQAAFSEIYTGFIDLLFAYGCKITHDHEQVKDCIQDIFVNFQRLNPTLHHPEYIEFYLFRSLKNAIYHKFQENKKTVNMPIEKMTVFDLHFNIEQEICDKESDSIRSGKLKSILQTLKPQKRELLFLKFSTGLNYIEIGHLLDMNPDTAKKQVYRTLDLLREKYGKQLVELLMIWVKGNRGPE